MVNGFSATPRETPERPVSAFSSSLPAGLAIAAAVAAAAATATTATATITTKAATATAATITTEAATAILARLGFVDFQRAAADFLAIQLLDGGSGFFLGCHFNEGEAP